MKKLFKTLITLCVCGLLSFSFVACTETAEVESSMPEEIVESTDSTESVETPDVQDSVVEHEHSYEEVVVEPTCITVGSKTYTCECGETYSEELAMLEHEYEKVVEVEPTCESVGKNVFTCKCGHSYEEEVDKIAHSYTEYKHIEPTCVTDGFSISYCDYGCGSYQYIAKEGSAKGHEYVKVEKVEPTCSAEGNEEYFICTCGKLFDTDKVEIKNIPTIDMLEHTYGELIEEVPSTCSVNGSIAHYTCVSCLKNFDVDKNEVESIELELVDHTYGDYLFDNEYHWTECVCGNLTEKIAHEYTKYNSCDICGRAKALSELEFVEVICLEDLTAELSKGNNVKLAKDIVGNISYSTDKEVVVDLNGHNITGNGDKGVICVNKGILNIVGKGVVTAIETERYAIAIFVRGGKVVVDGGIYVQEINGTDEQYDMIYCKEGELVINGGTFKCNTPKWTLNCYDSSYVEGTASITVNGGDFYGYDPSAVETETESPISFVSEDKVVENNEDWYNVK